LTDELHRLTFVQHLVSASLDGGEMHKDIFARLPLNKAKTLGSVEPLDYALFLQTMPPSSRAGAPSQASVVHLN
jgi:hypothetical protein